MKQKKIGVVLMTYGSATTAPRVREYMEHVYHGKASEEVIADFEERYRLVGHSPLVEITQQQAEFLEQRLNEEDSAEKKDEKASMAEQYIVRSGMLHSNPFIEKAVQDCKNAGAERCIGIILSPQFSSFIMDGYRAAFARAAEQAGFSLEQIAVAEPWPTESHFISLLVDRIEDSLKLLEERYGTVIPVVFTTHSLPERVVAKDPQYLDQLKATTDAVLARLRTQPGNTNRELMWFSGYQSAGHTPEEWLKPDLTDILAILKERGLKAVLIAPIQFLADHLEILYDLDIAAGKQCEDFGIAYHRIELPNTNPRFIESLSAITKMQLSLD